MKFNKKEVERLLSDALREDIGTGDITTNILIHKQDQAKAKIILHENATICGVYLLKKVFQTVSHKCKIHIKIHDGKEGKKGNIIASIQGPAQAILSGERVALNIIQHLSGISTLARSFIKKIKGTKTKILDTRKTKPGLRAIEKYATLVGGAKNHRMGLYDHVLVKDNHIKMLGGVKTTLQKLNKNKVRDFIIECGNITQLEQALANGAKYILLDNMSLKSLKNAVKINSGRAMLEASGNINLNNIKKIANTGVNFISVGTITHSAKSIDISLKVE
mgnify:FL=1|jgi:nicotinate-nucleotide pyrophosphorylase (carboxylating)|tara:strand:- start:4170 stop:5000 length:831 start_codon:yes stop_codon:yes gene_type:complete